MNCFAYVRVSTTKQRDEGASFEAQRGAIETYATRHGLRITRWFEEARTAASTGRNQFAEMLRRLQNNEAEGVIIHKIDRSARNLRDWSDFTDLMDLGITIHVASENLDLGTRGGRLSADIQAVVAADYSRNLRLEAYKGTRARYRQGLLPGRAPLGYLNHGKGKHKTICPAKGPLVRELFERYASGAYSLETTRVSLNRLGLRNLRGNPLSRNSVSKVLNNPFYYGLIVVKETGETYKGGHEPLISKVLFDRCQRILRGKTHHRTQRRRFAYSRLITCSTCTRSLIAERQKGNVYYRCHTKDCPVKCRREEEIEASLGRCFRGFRITPEERQELQEAVEALLGLSVDRYREQQAALELQIQDTQTRLTRLTDLLLDGVLDEEVYRLKKRELLERIASLEGKINVERPQDAQIRARIDGILEQAETAWLSRRWTDPLLKRRVVEETTSNLVASPNDVAVELRFPFQVLSGQGGVLYGGGQRDEPRTPTAQDNNPGTDEAANAQHLAKRLIQYAQDQIEAEEGGD